MFCSNCGKSIQENARFCWFCGKPCNNQNELIPTSDTPSYSGEYSTEQNGFNNSTDSLIRCEKSAIKTINDFIAREKNAFKFNTLLWIFAGGALLLFLLVASILFVKSIERAKGRDLQESINTEEVPLSDDLLFESVRDINDTKETNYYVYDENRNLIYELNENIDGAYTIYTLIHHVYYGDLEMMQQWATYIDYVKEFEMQGIKDEHLDTKYVFNSYDEDEKLIHQDFSDRSDHIEYIYNDKAQLIETDWYSDSKGTANIVTNEYDEKGNKIKETTKYVDSGFESEVTYKYDSGGKLIKCGNTIYKYDVAGHKIGGYTDNHLEESYKYVSDPEDTRENYEYINTIFDLNALEVSAQNILRNNYILYDDDDKQKTQAGIELFENTDKNLTKNEKKRFYGVGASDIESNEGPMPYDVYEEIKGTYDSEINGIRILIVSPSEALLVSGSYRETLVVEKYERKGNEHRLFISEDGVESMILSVLSQDGGDYIMRTMEGGGWDYDKTHIHASLERIGTEVVNEYIIPDSDKRLLTESDLWGLSPENLRIARNEIVARHGRKFKDQELQAYFDEQSWYSGYIEPDDFNKIVKLSDIEQANMDFIQSYEN